MLFALLALMAGYSQAQAPPAAPPAAPPGAVERPPDLSKAVSVDVEVEFDDSGKPKSCRIVKRSGSAGHDDSICADIMAGRAKFSWQAPPGRPPGPPSPPQQPRATPVEQSGKLAAGQSTRLVLINPPDPDAAKLLNQIEAFTPDDYPAEARRKREQGRVNAIVAVSEAGRPTGCSVGQSSGSASLDSATCANLLAKGRFSPQRNGQGRAIDGTISIFVAWVLPAPVPTALEERHERVIFAIGPRGDIGPCSTEFPGWRGEPGALCDEMRRFAAKWVKHDKEALANRDLVFETGLAIGGVEAIRGIGEGPGQRLLDLYPLHLTVDAEGHVTECTADEYNPSPVHTKKQCAIHRAEVYTPLDADEPNRSPRHIVIYYATYSRLRAQQAQSTAR